MILLINLLIYRLIQAKLQAILSKNFIVFLKIFICLTYQDVHLDILAGKITYQQKELNLTKNELKIFKNIYLNMSEVDCFFVIDLIEYLWDDHQFY